MALREAGRQQPSFRLSASVSSFGKEVFQDLFGKVAGDSPASVLLAAAEDSGGMELTGSSRSSTGGSATGSRVSPKTKRLMSSFVCFNPASQMSGKAAGPARAGRVPGYAESAKDPFHVGDTPDVSKGFHTSGPTPELLRAAPHRSGESFLGPGKYATEPTIWGLFAAR